MTGSSFPPPPSPTPPPPPPPSLPSPHWSPPSPAEPAGPTIEEAASSVAWWRRKAWILPVWAWVLVGLLGIGVISSAAGESDSDSERAGEATPATEPPAATVSAADPTTTVAPTTTVVTTTAAPDDSSDVMRWSIHAVDASEASAEVVFQIGDIATAAGSDTLGWMRGDYADAAIDAWLEATTMLEAWGERPTPVPERVAECDALATQMFEATWDIADVFSDMAIEGSTDVERLEQVGADMGAIGDMAEANTACIDRL